MNEIDFEKKVWVDRIQYSYPEYKEVDFSCYSLQQLKDLIKSIGRQKHYVQYENLAQRIGVDYIKKIIPFTEEQIKSALAEGDEHLNTIPLKKWDELHLSLKGIIKRPRPNVIWALCDSVCVAKHVAIYHIAGVNIPAIPLQEEIQVNP